MRVHIVYGTVEGQTKKIAQHVADRVSAFGHEAVVINAQDTSVGDTLPAKSDAVILAACVHQTAHQEALTDYAMAHRDALSSQPSAFLSVSLACAVPDGAEEAEGYISSFITETGWTPDVVLPVAGALRFDAYDFFKQQVVKFVVMQKGLDVAPGKDHEFTDWAALDGFVERFLQTASAGVKP